MVMNPTTVWIISEITLRLRMTDAGSQSKSEHRHIELHDAEE